MVARLGLRRVAELRPDARVSISSVARVVLRRIRTATISAHELVR